MRLSVLISDFIGELTIATLNGKLALLELGPPGYFSNIYRQRYTLEDGLVDNITCLKVLNAVDNNVVDYSLFAFKPEGTTFQHKVWNNIRTITSGSVKTYGQIAKEIGSTNAFRAVGTACGANPISIIIPCHRVVSANGDGGYRWGANIKRKLLEREKCQTGKIS